MFYIVIAYRYGNSQLHSYLIGLFEDYDKAIKVAERERDRRGGKYECFIYDASINEDLKGKKPLYSTDEI